MRFQLLVKCDANVMLCCLVDRLDVPVSSIFYPESRGRKFLPTLKPIYKITLCQISGDRNAGRNILVLPHKMWGGEINSLSLITSWLSSELLN
jgi:hypothetical protein